jgi:hypothetical protein
MQRGTHGLDERVDSVLSIYAYRKIGQDESTNLNSDTYLGSFAAEK